MHRPDRIFLRSTDAPPGSRPDAFTVSLGQYPVLNAKKCILTQLQVPMVYACPTFPEWGCKFSVYVNGTLRTWDLNAMGAGPRPFNTIADFVTWFTVTAADPDVALGVSDAGRLTVTAKQASVSSLAVPSTDPVYGWVLAPGQLESANRRLGFTTSNASQVTAYGQPPIEAPSWPNLLRTQCVTVISSIAPTSGVTSSGQTNVLASMGVDVPWLGVLTYKSTNPITLDGTARTIDTIRLELQDERGQPLYLVPQAVINAEISLVYE